MNKNIMDVDKLDEKKMTEELEKELFFIHYTKTKKLTYCHIYPIYGIGKDVFKIVSLGINFPSLGCLRLQKIQEFDVDLTNAIEILKKLLKKYNLEE